MKMFGISLPRGLRGWTSLIYKVVLLASILPVLDGLQAIGRGNSDMLPGLVVYAGVWAGGGAGRDRGIHSCKRGGQTQ